MAGNIGKINIDGSVTPGSVPGWIAMVEHCAAQAGMTVEEYWTRIQERDAEIQREVSGS